MNTYPDINSSNIRLFECIQNVTQKHLGYYVVIDNACHNYFIDTSSKDKTFLKFMGKVIATTSRYNIPVDVCKMIDGIIKHFNCPV